MKEFLNQLHIQRWDDHRYYHHSRINQALHLLSAVSFVVAYITLFFDPAIAALIAWIVSMNSRQIGHFFFEPKGYDEDNQATHDYKELIKVGYNIRRKVVLMALWALSPLALLAEPSAFGLLKAHTNLSEFVHNTGLLWFFLGIAGLAFRTVHLFFLRGWQCGMVWAAKILTDPFHDIKLYYKSPYYLMKGELIAPRAQH